MKKKKIGKYPSPPIPWINAFSSLNVICFAKLQFFYNSSFTKGTKDTFTHLAKFLCHLKEIKTFSENLQLFKRGKKTMTPCHGLFLKFHNSHCNVTYDKSLICCLLISTLRIWHNMRKFITFMYNIHLHPQLLLHDLIVVCFTQCWPLQKW